MARIIQNHSQPHDLTLYTDGSVRRWKSGWGFCVKKGATTIHEDSLSRIKRPAWLYINSVYKNYDIETYHEFLISVLNIGDVDIQLPFAEMCKREKKTRRKPKNVLGGRKYTRLKMTPGKITKVYHKTNYAADGVKTLKKIPTTVTSETVTSSTDVDEVPGPSSSSQRHEIKKTEPTRSLKTTKKKTTPDPVPFLYLPSPFQQMRKDVCIPQTVVPLLAEIRQDSSSSSRRRRQKKSPSPSSRRRRRGGGDNDDDDDEQTETKSPQKDPEPTTTTTCSPDDDKVREFKLPTLFSPKPSRSTNERKKKNKPPVLGEPEPSSSSPFQQKPEVASHFSSSLDQHEEEDRPFTPLGNPMTPPFLNREESLFGSECGELLRGSLNPDVSLQDFDEFEHFLDSELSSVTTPLRKYEGLEDNERDFAGIPRLPF
ncbi:hypothetical protein [Thiolapillus sp.]|uniref:hypothetical protein n=1 Tax=Thiolapillus sp. TaxID=2017437 RepID=UPI003AF42F09